MTKNRAGTSVDGYRHRSLVEYSLIELCEKGGTCGDVDLVRTQSSLQEISLQQWNELFGWALKNYRTGILIEFFKDKEQIKNFFEIEANKITIDNYNNLLNSLKNIDINHPLTEFFGKPDNNIIKEAAPDKKHAEASSPSEEDSTPNAYDFSQTQNNEEQPIFNEEPPTFDDNLWDDLDGENNEALLTSDNKTPYSYYTDDNIISLFDELLSPRHYCVFSIIKLDDNFIKNMTETVAISTEISTKAAASRKVSFFTILKANNNDWALLYFIINQDGSKSNSQLYHIPSWKDFITIEQKNYLIHTLKTSCFEFSSKDGYQHENSGVYVVSVAERISHDETNDLFSFPIDDEIKGQCEILLDREKKPANSLNRDEITFLSLQHSPIYFSRPSTGDPSISESNEKKELPAYLKGQDIFSLFEELEKRELLNSLLINGNSADTLAVLLENHKQKAAVDNSKKHFFMPAVLDEHWHLFYIHYSLQDNNMVSNIEIYD